MRFPKDAHRQIGKGVALLPGTAQGGESGAGVDLEETLAERARARGCDSLAEIDLVIAITLLTDELPTTRDIDRVRDAVGRRGLTVQRRVPQPT